MENRDKNIIYIILSILGIIFIVTIFSKLFKEYLKITNSDIVSSEGKKILNNPKQRAGLRKAIEHYHKEGNWDEEELYKLSEVN